MKTLINIFRKHINIFLKKLTISAFSSTPGPHGMVTGEQGEG
jgi:hypothetical protein